MDRRLIFNEDEKNYDKFRPTYCKALFDAIIDYSGLDANKKAVEIGIGTGQATTPILETGCSVTAIELGDRLAIYSKNKFSAYDNFVIHNISFEDYIYTPKSIDLIYSGTAFHWIPEEIGYPKVFDMLTSGGTLALFWNRPSGRKNSAHKELQSIYKKYMPTAKLSDENNQEKYNMRMDTIRKHGFVDLQFKLMHQIRSFNAEDYVSLLNTYSDHRILSSDIKESFFAEIKSVINRFGGYFKVYDTIDLYLAKKP